MRTQLATLAALTVAAALLLGGNNAGKEMAVPDFAEREVTRLHAHFDSVDVELRTASVAGLTPAQRQSRATLIDWLGDYRDRGVFPRNDRFATATPFFRDADGVLCAMAYLIDRSGRADIVDRIARTRNNALIKQLGDDRALGAWLDSVGLSATEAGRIQPQYGFPPNAEEDDASPYYALGSIVTGVPTLVFAGYNAFSPGKASGVMGAVTGLASVLLGSAKLNAHGRDRNLAKANLLVGITGLALSYRGLTHDRARAGQRPTPRRSSLLSRTSIVPVVESNRDRSAHSVGLGFRTRF